MAAVLVPSTVAAPVREAGPWHRAWLRLRRRKGALAGLAVVLLFVLLALFAPWIAPHDPIAASWAAIRKAPMSPAPPLP